MNSAPKVGIRQELEHPSPMISHSGSGVNLAGKPNAARSTPPKDFQKENSLLPCVNRTLSTVSEPRPYAAAPTAVPAPLTVAALLTAA